MQNTGGLYLFRTVCLSHCDYHLAHSDHLTDKVLCLIVITHMYRNLESVFLFSTAHLTDFFYIYL